VGGIFSGLAAHVREKVNREGDQKDTSGEDMGGILDACLGGIKGALEGGKPYVTPWTNVVDDGYAWENKPDAEKAKTLKTLRYGVDGERLLVLVWPPKDAEDSHASVEKLREVLAGYRTSPAWKDMQLGLTGGPVLEYDEMETYRKDATIATAVGFFAVIFLFIISFRRVLGPVCAGICLAMAIALTLAFAAIWPGHLNLLSIVFMEILIGLGIDFGIHLISRYDEERTYGTAPGPALEAALGLTGRASAAGAMTTALAFSATFFADFQGIKEFGIIAAVGILCCLATMLLVLPALIVLADKGAYGLSRRPRPGWARTQVAIKLDHWAIRRPRRLVLVSLAFALGMLFLASKWVRYSGNLLELQATNLESVQYANDLVQGDTLGNLVADSREQLEDYARKLGNLGNVVQKTESVPVFEDEKLELIGRIAKVVNAVPGGPVTPPSITPRQCLASLQGGLADFNDSLNEAKDMAGSAGRHEDVGGIETLQGQLDQIIALADPEGPDAEKRGAALLVWETGLRGELLELMERLRVESTQAHKVTVAELPQVLRERLVGKTGKLLMIIYPKKPIFDDAPLEEFVTQIRTGGGVPAYAIPQLTGVPVQIYETGKRMKEGYEVAGLLAFFAIAIYLLVHFRSVGYAAITLLALVAGAAIGLGFLALKGETVNPANMLAIPLTLGIGVCYAIQLVHRHRQAMARPSVAGPQPVIATSTGRGVILSAGTNVVGFGALALAHHHGTASLGYTITFGVLGCLVTALFFLPALLRLWTGPGAHVELRGEPGPRVGPEGKVARPVADERPVV
jgi:predicted RND superfamily exporter protein